MAVKAVFAASELLTPTMLSVITATSSVALVAEHTDSGNDGALNPSAGEALFVAPELITPTAISVIANNALPYLCLEVLSSVSQADYDSDFEDFDAGSIAPVIQPLASAFNINALVNIEGTTVPAVHAVLEGYGDIDSLLVDRLSQSFYDDIVAEAFGIAALAFQSEEDLVSISEYVSVGSRPETPERPSTPPSALGIPGSSENVAPPSLRSPSIVRGPEDVSVVLPPLIGVPLIQNHVSAPLIISALPDDLSEHGTPPLPSVNTRNSDQPRAKELTSVQMLRQGMETVLANLSILLPAGANYNYPPDLDRSICSGLAWPHHSDILFDAVTQALYDQFQKHREYQLPNQVYYERKTFKPAPLSTATLLLQCRRIMESWIGFSEMESPNVDQRLMETVKNEGRTFIDMRDDEVAVKQELVEDIWDALINDTVNELLKTRGLLPG